MKHSLVILLVTFVVIWKTLKHIPDEQGYVWISDCQQCVSTTGFQFRAWGLEKEHEEWHAMAFDRKYTAEDFVKQCPDKTMKFKIVEWK